MKLSRTTGIAIATLSLIAVGGIAGAAIPTADGTINGCYISGQGTLRVIDTETTTCKNNETPINWSQTGAPGVNGEDGEDGEDGQAGAPGANGVSGYQVVPANGTISPRGEEKISRYVYCPPGQVAVGGGATQSDPTVAIGDSYPITSGGDSGWAVGFVHAFPPGFGGTPPFNYTMYAVCINAH